MSDTAYTPCITCGACCAHFRVSFHWSETDPSLGGTVPAELTEKLNEHRVAMHGTQCRTPRCVALQGEIGVNVYCSIYPQRASTCREFHYAWENNQPHDRCDQARAGYGLPPLQSQIVAAQIHTEPSQLYTLQPSATTQILPDTESNAAAQPA